MTLCGVLDSVDNMCTILKTMKDTKDNKTIFATEHYGKWVALSADRRKVLDYSDDLEKLAERNGDEAVYVIVQNPNFEHAF